MKINRQMILAVGTMGLFMSSLAGCMSLGDTTSSASTGALQGASPVEKGSDVDCDGDMEDLVSDSAVPDEVRIHLDGVIDELVVDSDNDKDDVNVIVSVGCGDRDHGDNDLVLSGGSRDSRGLDNGGPGEVREVVGDDDVGDREVVQAP